MNEEEVYGKSAMNPKGIKVDPTRCVKSVADCGGWHVYQCARKRGHGKDGKYCKQHGKKHPA